MRKRPKERLEDIAEAAIDAFSESGYRRTQMADVARRLGLSAGALYLYVESKEALFHLAVMRLCGVPLDAVATPIRTVPFETTADLLASRAAQQNSWPSLHPPAKSRNVRADLERLGRDLYDTLSGLRRAIWFIDRCAPEIPELDRVYGRNVRGDLLDQLADYLLQERRMEEPLRAQTLFAARGAIELIAWAAMHRHRETEPNRLTGLSDDQIKEVAARSFAAALAPLAGT